MMRNFIQIHPDGEERGIYAGKQPRQAALKVANRSLGTRENPVEIRIRERGTKNIHVYMGGRMLFDAPEVRPGWLPAKIYKPFVKKVELAKAK